MKIFSTFDTKFKHKSLVEKKEKYGQDKVHLLEKSSFFLLKNIIIPFFVIIILTLLSGYILSEYLKTPPIVNIIIMSGILLMGVLYAAIIKHYIDYKMDYCIVTPDEIILTEQSGLFNRWIRTLDITKVKSISVQKHDLFNSLFNNWAIIFMSEGDDKLGEIVLEYIHNPEWKRNLLHNIIMKE